MTRHVVWGLLLLLALTVRPAEAEEPAPLGDEEALKLLQEAAQISPAYMRTLLALDRRGAQHVLSGAGTDAPLTATMLLLCHRPTFDDQEFRWRGPLSPKAVTAALYPVRLVGTRQVPEHAHANVLHRSLIRTLVVRNEGDEAHGTIAFEVPRVFSARVHWRAGRDHGGRWQVRAFTFPRSRVRVTYEHPRWRADVPHARSTVNPRRDLQLTLPKVGTVGIEPPKNKRIVISVTRDGYIHLGRNDSRLSLEDLREALEARAAPDAVRDASGDCVLGVLLDVDADTPWTIVQWLMVTCAHPAIRIRRVYFGARESSLGLEGALATRLPRDRSGPAMTTAPPPRIRVKAFHGSGPVVFDASEVFSALVAIPRKQRKEAIWELSMPPPHGGKVRHGHAMMILDAMMAAGAHAAFFEGAVLPLDDAIATDPEALARYIRELKAVPGATYVKIGPKRVDAQARQIPVPVHGRVNGVRGAVAFDDEDPRLGLFWMLPPNPRDNRPAIPEQPKPKDATPMWLKRREAIKRGLLYLAHTQTEDGSWPAGKPHMRVGVTGLAVLAFLEAGYTNRGKHPFAKVVSKGLRYLKNQQDVEGCFGKRDHMHYNYVHAAAAMAMVTAYGETGSPIFKGSAQRALDFIALTRNPGLAWRYGVKPGDNDTSMTTWMFRVLEKARVINQKRIDRGQPPRLTFDTKARAGVVTWLDRMTDPDSGRTGYTARGAGPSRLAKRLKTHPGDVVEPTTAAALHCRMLLGQDAKAAVLERGFGLLLNRLPAWEPTAGRVDFTYWLWGTHACFRAGGATWKRWVAALNTALLAGEQKTNILYAKKTVAAGSWDPVGAWGEEGGRVYATAMAVLALRVDFRFVTLKPK